MAAISNSLVVSKRSSLHFSPGSSLKSADGLGSTNLAFSFNATKKSSAKKGALIVQASYSDGGRSGNGEAFVSGFVGGFALGGLIVATLGVVYAPKLSEALTGPERKELLRKLPNFIYDEEKALEKQRKKLEKKIEELHLAIDNVSSQFRKKGTSDEESVDVGGNQSVKNPWKDVKEPWM